VRKIVTTPKLQLPFDIGFRYVTGQHTDNPEAYDDYLRGLEPVFTEESVLKERAMLEKAIELDPAYTDAYAWLGYNYFWSWYSQYGGDDPRTLDQAIELEQKVIAMDDTHSLAHAFLCRYYPFKSRHDQAVAECQRALALAPSNPFPYFWLAETFVRSGKPNEAIGFYDKVERLDPHDRANWESGKGTALRHHGTICRRDSPFPSPYRVESGYFMDPSLDDHRL
jgi:tetratricopeptide (TPR) repeat protein